LVDISATPPMPAPRGEADIAAITAHHPIPACRIVAVTLPPALDSAFIVSLIAATGAVNDP
jgi:hypothetical protein